MQMTASLFITSLLSSLCLTLTGCMGDKTESDLRNQQVLEQVQKIKNTVAGLYVGDLISEKDNTLLGTLSLSLIATTTVQNSSDNLSTEQRASLRGILTYDGIPQPVVFEQGNYQSNYDDNSGTLQANFNLNWQGSSVPMALNATLASERFSGHIEALTSPGYGANFVLVKTTTPLSSMPPSAAVKAFQNKKLRSITLPSSTGNTRTLTGTYRYNNQDEPVSLSLSLPKNFTDQPFAGLFVSVLDLEGDCTLEFHYSDQSGTVKLPPVHFSHLIYDDYTHTLRGSSVTGNSNAILMCTQKTSANNTETWNCSLTTHDTITFTVTQQTEIMKGI